MYTNRRYIAPFALFFVGYNLLLASVLLSVYPVPPPHRTIYFANGDFVPWRLVYNPQWTFMQSRPFQLYGGEVLTGSFEVYRLWNGSGVQLDPPQEVQVKLEPPAYLYPGPGGTGPPIWWAFYSSVVTMTDYQVPGGAPYTLIVSTYTADCNNNCSVNISGVLTATTLSAYSSWQIPLAIGGVFLLVSPGLWVVGERVWRQRGGGKGMPPSPPST